VRSGQVSPYGNSPAVAQQYAAHSSGYSSQKVHSASPVLSSSSWSAPAAHQDQQQAPAQSSAWSSLVSSQGPATYGEQMVQLPLGIGDQQSALTYSGPAAPVAQQTCNRLVAQQSAPAYANPSAFHGKQQHASIGSAAQQSTPAYVGPTTSLVFRQPTYNGTAVEPSTPSYADPSASLGHQQQAYNGPVAQKSTAPYDDPSVASQPCNRPVVQLAPADQSTQQSAPSNTTQSFGLSAYNGDDQVASPSQQYDPAQQQSYSAPIANAVQSQAADNPVSGQEYSKHAVPDKRTVIPAPALMVPSPSTTSMKKTTASPVSTKMASTARSGTGMVKYSYIFHYWFSFNC